MRKPHKHQDPRTNAIRECDNADCKLAFRSPELKPVNKRRAPRQHASRAEQHARYIDCGPQNWDDN